MNLEIEWGHTFNVEAREPELRITTIYEVGGKRVKTVQLLSRHVIAGFRGGVSIFDIIRVAASALVASAAAIEDKRKRVARAAMMEAAMAGSLSAHLAANRSNGLDRRKLH